MEKLLLVEHPIRVFAYDIDGMSIVSNTVYIKWFEQLRTYFLDKYLPLETMMANRISPVLQKTIIEYKRPITIHNQPIGKVWIEHLGRAKWQCNFEILVGEKLHATGEQYGYFYHIDRKRVVPVPEALTTAYEAAKK